MELLDALTDPSQSRRPGSIARLAGSGNLPAQQVPFYTPESAPQLAAPADVPRLAAPATQPAGPLSRAAGMAPAGLAAGAIGLLAGGAAATGAATGGVATNPDYFKTSIGDDGLAANILSAAQQPQKIADVAQTARTANGPLNVPVIAQSGNSTAGAGRGSVNPPSPIAALMPQYDDAYRAQNLTNNQNQAYREGDPIGDIIRQKMGPQQDITQPADSGGGSFLNVGGPSGGQPQARIGFATFGGGSESSKAYRADGTTTDLRPGLMSGQGLPDDVQQFNQQSAQAGQDQQPVSVIRGLTQTVAQPNPTAGQASGYMQEVPRDIADGGPDAIAKYQAAQTQNAVNAADPMAAKSAAEIAKVKEENKGKVDVARVTNGVAETDAPATAPILGVPVPAVKPWTGQTNSRDANKVQAAEIARGGKEVEKDSDAARALALTAQDAKQFLELNQKNSTGGVIDKTGVGRWAKGFSPDYATMEAITSKLTPNARPAGSGSSSDSDMRLFGRATIGVDKPQETNANIAKGIIANAKQQQDYANFRQTYLEQNRTLAGSERYWKEYVDKNPIFDPSKEKAGTFDLNPARKDWREHFAPKSDGTATASGAPAGAQQPAVKVVPFNGTKTEAKLAPDGNYYVKQPNGKYAMVKE
jgi:hypothetical protein